MVDMLFRFLLFFPLLIDDLSIFLSLNLIQEKIDHTKRNRCRVKTKKKYMERKETKYTAEEKQILEQILAPTSKEAQLPPPLPPPITLVVPPENKVKIDVSKCNPSKCKQQCASSCPVNTRLALGKAPRPCMKIGEFGKMTIDLETCTHCRTCERYCPLKAIYFY
jgi:ferredoxin